MIRTGYGIPAHDGMGAGGGGKILPPSPSPSPPPSPSLLEQWLLRQWLLQQWLLQQWLLQQWLWGVDPKKVGLCINTIEYGYFFKGVFSENTLYTCSRFCQFPKRGHLSEISTENYKNGLS